MTVHHPLDRLRVDPPPEQPDYSGADLERDMPDLLEGYDKAGLYDGDGDLYAARIGGLTLTDAQVRQMLDPAHYARIRSLDGLALRDARADWEDAMADRARDNAEGRG